MKTPLTEAELSSIDNAEDIYDVICVKCEHPNTRCLCSGKKCSIKDCEECNQ